MKQKPTMHDQSTITTTMEIEEPTEEGSDPDGTSTTTEDLTWSPPVSRTIGTAGTPLTTDHNEETTQKTSLGSETRMEDKAAARWHSRIPLRQRTTRRTVFYTRIQK